jgi:hypothetical protein
MSEYLSEQAAEIARVARQRDDLREVLVVRERVLKARIAERDAVLGAVAALVERAVMVAPDPAWSAWETRRQDAAQYLAVLAPVSGAVECHPYDDRCGPNGACRNHGGVVSGAVAKPDDVRSREVETFVQWLWDEGLMPKHVGGATIQPDWLLRQYFGDIDGAVAKHEQEVRAGEAWDLAVEEAFHCGHLHDAALAEMRERNPYRADALTEGNGS